MMYERMYVRMYMSITLRNIVVTSCRNVVSMIRIRRASYTLKYWWSNDFTPNQAFISIGGI